MVVAILCPCRVDTSLCCPLQLNHSIWKAKDLVRLLYLFHTLFSLQEQSRAVLTHPSILSLVSGSFDHCHHISISPFVMHIHLVWYSRSTSSRSTSTSGELTLQSLLSNESDWKCLRPFLTKRPIRSLSSFLVVSNFEATSELPLLLRALTDAYWKSHHRYNS